jgi:hypothetical protein
MPKKLVEATYHKHRYAIICEPNQKAFLLKKNGTFEGLARSTRQGVEHWGCDPIPGVTFELKNGLQSSALIGEPLTENEIMNQGQSRAALVFISSLAPKMAWVPLKVASTSSHKLPPTKGRQIVFESSSGLIFVSQVENEGGNPQKSVFYWDGKWKKISFLGSECGVDGDPMMLQGVLDSHWLVGYDKGHCAGFIEGFELIPYKDPKANPIDLVDGCQT